MYFRPSDFCILEMLSVLKLDFKVVFFFVKFQKPLFFFLVEHPPKIISVLQIVIKLYLENI